MTVSETPNLKLGSSGNDHVKDFVTGHDLRCRRTIAHKSWKRKWQRRPHKETICWIQKGQYRNMQWTWEFLRLSSWWSEEILQCVPRENLKNYVYFASTEPQKLHWSLRFSPLLCHFVFTKHTLQAYEAPTRIPTPQHD